MIALLRMELYGKEKKFFVSNANIKVRGSYKVTVFPYGPPPKAIVSVLSETLTWEVVPMYCFGQRELCVYIVGAETPPQRRYMHRTEPS